jgi:plastocyanin
MSRSPLSIIAAFSLVASVGALSVREAPVARFAAAGSQGTLSGQVRIERMIAGPPPRPDVAGSGSSEKGEPAARQHAVVYLETAPQPAFEETRQLRATIRQQDETFVPHVIAVRVGTVVDFPNLDPFYHNVFSLSKARRFDLGRYGKGRSKSVRFDEPGIVRIFCDIHTHMSAFVLVFAHRFFAVTDEEGNYRIEQVPQGTYSVVAWYEGISQESRTATVPREGGSVRLDFRLQ